MLALLFLSIAEAGPAEQMLTNGAGRPLHWTAMPIRYNIDPTNSADLIEEGVVAAIVEASAAWAFVEGAEVEYRFLGTERGAVGGYDDHSVVFFSDTWEVSPDLLAVTSTWSNEEGEILDFDMVVNTTDHAWALDGDPELEDLQNTLAHEFGHALGFGHEELDKDATMFPSAHPGELGKRDLGATDEELARFAYPSALEDTAEEPLRSPGCNAAGGHGGWAAVVWIAALLRRSKGVKGC
jgi:hypothetical protein